MTRPIKLRAGRIVCGSAVAVRISSRRWVGLAAKAEPSCKRRGASVRACAGGVPASCVLFRLWPSEMAASSDARARQDCRRHRRNLQAPAPRIAEQQSEAQAGKREDAALHPGTQPCSCFSGELAACGRVRESTSRSSPFLAVIEKMTSTDPVELLIREGRGVDAVGRSRGLDGRGVADGDLQGRIGNRLVGDGVVDEDREPIILQDTDDLIQVGSCGDPWISRGDHRGFVAIAVIVPFMGNGNGQTKKKARQASKAGCAKPREPPFQAALYRKH